MKRKKLTKKGSRRLFRKTAQKVNPRNNVAMSSMRGGTRM